MDLKLIAKFGAALLFAFCIACTVFAESKTETIGAFTGENLQSILQDKGIRVIDGDKPLCEIWFRKSMPADDSKADPGVLYPQFKTSNLIGVITFSSASKDFRGLMIQPGTYALRFALQPADGNHMGTAPDRDFLVLTPLDSEINTSETLTFQQLMTLAGKASSGHPWALILVSPPEDAESGKLITNDSGHLVLSTTINDSKGTSFPVALVVKGVSDSI